MNIQDKRQAHWESVYQHKSLEECSWYQDVPTPSLDFMHRMNLPKEAAILDVGGGDSLLVDHLLGLGYLDLSVLDISEKALARAQARLGARAEEVNWIACDIVDFKPNRQYDFWHDRAVFHFLREEDDIEKYIRIAEQAIKSGGHLLLATFSLDGPQKCSGLDIRQYSAESLVEAFSASFLPIACKAVAHHTPSQKVQSFIFCHFRRKNYV